MVARIEPRWLVVTGSAIMTVSLLYGSTMDGNVRYFPTLFVLVLVVGFGVGLAVVPLPLCAISGVGPHEIGPLSAIAQVAQTLGGPVGLGVIGAMATSRTMSLGGVSGTVADMTDAQLVAQGEGYMFALVGCAVCAVIAGVAALFIRFTPEEVAQAQEPRRPRRPPDRSTAVADECAHACHAGPPGTRHSCRSVFSNGVDSSDRGSSARCARPDTNGTSPSKRSGPRSPRWSRGSS